MDFLVYGNISHVRIMKSLRVYGKVVLTIKNILVDDLQDDKYLVLR